MSKEYNEANARYAAMAAKAKGGDKDAMKEKAIIVSEMRQMERAAARDGRVLNAVNNKGKIEVKTETAESKRSLQEEYVRKFDDKKPVVLEGRQTTLRAYHRERLLAK